MARKKLSISNKGKKFSKEHKNKIRLAKIGTHLSDESKTKISCKLKGRKFSKETIKKFSIAGFNQSEEKRRLLSEQKLGINNPNFGKIFSHETRLKMKESRKNFVLPIKDTSIEVKIQNFLKELKIEFFTHQYMNIEHGYQCDIFVPSMNLVLETDGNYWHKYPTGREIDHIRTKELLEKGFKVLRLWESDIKVMDLNKFKEIIN